MKAFICVCLLVLATCVNAGLLLGELSGVGAGGYSYGGGHNIAQGYGPEASIVKVIHEQPAAVVGVVHAPQIVKVIHEDHGHYISGPVPSVHHVQVIHEHGDGLAHSHVGTQEVRIIKVIHDQGHHLHGSHGWA